MSHFFTSRTHSHNVKRWLQEKEKNKLRVERILTTVPEFTGASPTLQNTYAVCELLYPILEFTLDK